MQSRKIKILTINHNPESLINLKSLISEAFPDALIYSATSGEKGLELAVAEEPDVVFLDILMPGMDGFEICKKIKADDNLQDTPVVFVTANNENKANRIKALEVGAEAFISKPIDEIELTALIRSMVKIKNANLERRNEKVNLAQVVNKIHETEQRYRLLAENVNDVIWVVDPITTRFLYISPSVETALGYTPHEMMQMTFIDTLHPEIREPFLNLMQQRIENFKTNPESNDRYAREAMHVHKNGRIIYAEIVNHYYFNKSTSRLEIQGVNRDITERKKSDDKLRESELRYRLLAENVHDVIWVVDPITTRFLYISPSVETVLGYTPHEMMQMAFSDTLLPEIRETFLNLMQERIENFKTNPESTNKYVHEAVHVHKNGSILYAEIANHYYLNKSTGRLEIQGVSRDITERKKSDDKLRESELRYRLLAENVNDVIWVVDPITARFLYISPSVETALGYTPHEMMQIAWSDIFLPEIRETFINLVQQRVENFNTNPESNNRYAYETGHVHKNGSILYVEIANHYYLNKSTGRLEIQGVSRDITERKKSDDKLRESELRYRLLAENVKDIIWVLDPATGHFIYISPSVESELGYTTDEMKEMHFSETLLPEIREPFLQSVKERIKDFYINPEFTSEYLHEVVHRHKNGKIIYAEISNHYYLNKNTGKLEIQGVSRDITERKRREKFQTLSTEILAVLNTDLDLKEIIDTVIKLIQQETKFSAVGIRLKQNDDFPYFSHSGFPDNFLLTQNTLTIKDSSGNICRGEDGKPLLECTCGLVISGKTDPANPLFTDSGSFVTNNSLPLIELPGNEEPKLNSRNTCIHLGYSSIALIPIRTNEIIIGTLQLNEKKKDAFNQETISFFENICLSIGNALMRRKAEELLRQSEEDYRKMFEEHAAVILIIDPENGNIYDANKAAEDYYGWSNEEFKKIRFYDINIGIIPDEIKERLSKIFELQSFHKEFKHKKANGVTRDVEVFVNPVKMGAKQYLHTIIFDIQDRKQAEIEILNINNELHQLSSHLQNIREEERSHIAREIHDELGQQITALKMDIDSIIHKQSTQDIIAVSKLQDKLKELLPLCDEIITTVRKISSDLRPAMIDDLGLIAALEWKCLDFQEKTGVSCKFIAYSEERKFENNFSINVFRILQETLTNVSRHAHAKSVIVSVRENQRELTMQIEDDGIGIDTSIPNKAKTLGITGMKERASLLGGNLIVTGEKNKGTQIKLILPLKNEYIIS